MSLLYYSKPRGYRIDLWCRMAQWEIPSRLAAGESVWLIPGTELQDC